MDQRFDNQVTQLALPASTDAAALDLLRYFPNLTTIDALSCTCYDALMSKSLERQDITFTWQVQIGDVTLLNTDAAEPVHLRRGDRIAQLVIQQVERARFVPAERLPGSHRGSGGFGSSGGWDPGAAR